MSKSLIIFTSKPLEQIIMIGGSGWWKVDPVKARNASRVVLVHNAFDKHRPGHPSKHGKSFLIATIRDLAQDHDGRWLIQFDEYAATNDGVRWPGYRNPVNYTETDALVASLEVEDWNRMPNVSFSTAQDIRRHNEASSARILQRATYGSEPHQNAAGSFGEIIEQHRKQLADELGVHLSSVKISIETST